VRVLLEALIANGLLPDSPDSRSDTYGPGATQLVEEFQQRQGLTVDGIVGPKTWGALLTVVKPSDRGAHVVVLQTTLIVRGLMLDTAGNHDGDYGPATQSVVRQFQTLAGLGSDGEVGPKTWTALIGAKQRIAARTRGAVQPDDGVDLDDLDMLVAYQGLPAE
jgi:peptidoglycan hydrolase-like protein with peptidoglycan-binding domain